MPRSHEPTNYSRWNQALRGVDVASLMETVKDNMCHGTCFYWGLQGGTKEPERQRLLRQVVVRIHYQLSLEELLRVSFHSSHSRFRYNKALFYFLLWMVKEFSRLHFSELEGLPAELQPLTLSGLKKIYHQREYMKYRPLAEAAWDACAAQCE